MLNKFISTDFESESLRLIGNKPWQCAFTLFNHKEILEQKEYWIWWPDLKMSQGAAIATKFNWDTYEQKANPEFGAPTAFLPNDFLDDFEKYLYDSETSLVGQNWLGFDTYILASLQKTLGRKADFSYLERMFDTSLICKGLKMDKKPELDNMLGWQYKLLNEKAKIKTNLKALALEYDVPYDESRHHAEAKYDTELAMRVFQKIKYKLQ